MPYASAEIGRLDHASLDNSAEAVKHISKLKADWQQLPVSSCVENVCDNVQLQYIELSSALSGQGNFTLIPAFLRHL